MEFDIKPKLVPGLKSFVYSQLFVTPKPPKHSFAGQTIIVTGANSGLGLEASRHFYQLGAAKLILAVRTPSKGQAAKEEIVRSVKGRSDGATAIDVWALDVSSSASVLAFAERVRRELPRVDVVLENAGVNNHAGFDSAEGIEATMQINVLNTFLLALALLPKLKETKSEFPASSPHLVIVSSDAHRLTKFVEINAPNIYEAFNDKSTYSGQARQVLLLLSPIALFQHYSKLLQLLVLRELVSRLKAKDQKAAGVTLNAVSPGLCVSNIDRGKGAPGLASRILYSIFYRTAEVGSRTLVHGAFAGPDTNGEYLVDLKKTPVEWWIDTDMGRRVQRKAYEQTVKILEERKPGILQEAGLA
ncbi:NAD(P)-binding protein [Biscogniauxia mediterranea]|nr:NAD(P)-binding protein [Biscogniauxia mediterranea]